LVLNAAGHALVIEFRPETLGPQLVQVVSGISHGAHFSTAHADRRPAAASRQWTRRAAVSLARFAPTAQAALDRQKGIRTPPIMANRGGADAVSIGLHPWMKGSGDPAYGCATQWRRARKNHIRGRLLLRKATPFRAETAARERRSWRRRPSRQPRRFVERSQKQKQFHFLLAA